MYDEFRENQRELNDHLIQRTDPYGLWIILNKQGKQVVSGSYTNTRDAVKALENHLESKTKKTRRSK